MAFEYIDNYLRDAEQMIYSNKVSEALDLMNSLLYEEPGYAILHNHLGWAYLYYRDDLVKAELHLRTAIRFNENYAPPYLHLSALYMRMHRYTDAAAILETGLQKAEVNRVSFYEALGEAYELVKNYKKAVASYKMAMRNTTGPDTVRIIDKLKSCRRKRLALLFY